MHITGVILAGGQSSRLGRPKQLLDYRGKRLLQHVVDVAVESDLDDVLVVLGAYQDKIKLQVDFSEARTTYNEAFAEGHSTAIHAALRALRPETDAAMFILGDQPDITAEIVNDIAGHFNPKTMQIVVPVYEGTRGNPVLFGKALFPEIYLLLGDAGARPIIERHPGLVGEVAMPGQILRDVDTEEDYAELLRNSPKI